MLWKSTGFELLVWNSHFVWQGVRWHTYPYGRQSSFYKKIHHLLKFNKIEYITKIWKFSWNIMMNEILTFKVKAISFFPQFVERSDSINKLKSNNRIRNCTFFMLTSSCGLQTPYMCCWHILWPRCFNLNPKKYSMCRLATSKMFSSSPNFQQDKWIPYISFGLSNIWRKILMQNLRDIHALSYTSKSYNKVWNMKNDTEFLASFSKNK